MSEWCGNCHAALVEDAYVSGVAGHTHPAANAAKLTATIAANYNAYVATGDLTGTSANSYNNLVPYEEGTADIATLVALAGSSNAPLTGPTTASNVSCLSCHRVHASAFPSMTRYGVDSLVTDEAGVFEARSGFNAAAIQASYYGRGDSTQNSSFGNAQRALCNKCHVKD
jgi:predicted CXXCH cytochrome family protein